MEKNKDDSSSTVVNNYYNSELDGDNSANDGSISFIQIWRMIKKHWVAIVVFSLVGLACGVGYGRLIKEAQYEATSQIIILGGNQSSDDLSSDLSMARQKAQIALDYMTTEEVMEETCKTLAPTYSEYDIYINDNKDKAIETLTKQYAVSVSSSQIFVSITATTKEKQLSIDLANAVANSTYSLANGSGNMSYVLKGSLSVSEASVSIDSSTSNVVIALIGTLIGLVVGCAYSVIVEMANPKVASKSELERVTGIRVLGVIPKYMDEETNKEGNSNE